jgi:endonuclease YncB( thermonuclease family)
MILLFGTALLVGCTQTSGSEPSSTLRGLRTIDISPPSTLAPPTNTSATIGYVVVVADGATFDLQGQGGMPNRRFVIPHIQVPLIGTCEGDVSRGTLASIIHGKQVRIDPGGVVWIGDIDVGMAMVSYGMAVHVGEWYQAADANSPDINCANTTTLPPPPVIIVAPQTRPRPVRTTVVEDTVPVTDPVTEPEPQETAPPPARPEPVTTDAPRTDPPRETRPPKTDPEPAPVVTDEPDRTPKTPKPPKTPDVPDTAG